MGKTSKTDLTVVTIALITMGLTAILSLWIIIALILYVVFLSAGLIYSIFV